ncbi:MAG: T9SS type A sorting domain-containing protein [Bacteroidia bacterium]|nr:T9SS type A sorting domain-containing protein [Bacteroidia bacterium]
MFKDRLYIGTGTLDFGGGTKDFWEWKQSTNTWTQKADVGGQERLFAVGFSIGSKGYIGTGTDGNTNVGMTDFWEYDPAYNTWTQKAPFPGAARFGATGFCIGTKGYIGTGRCDPNYYKDFWEYNPATDTWTQKADFGGTPRAHATGFFTVDKGYIGTGYLVSDTIPGNVGYYKDFWEYNPSADTWTQKADYAGVRRVCPASFCILKSGYIGTGQDSICNGTKDFWYYDMDNDSWTQKADLTGPAREGAVGFSIGSKGYIGTGHTYPGSPVFDKDLWEYDPSATGISKTPANNMAVTVFPNPVCEYAVFNIEGLPFYQSVELTLYNAAGSEVKNMVFNKKYVLYRAGLPSGVYFYSISCNSGILGSGKLILK